MGKQINFYISNQTQQKFISFLNEQGYVFLKSGLLNSEYFIQPENVIMESQVYLYKENFGPYTVTNLKNTDMQSILSSHNPVIEYSLSKTNSMEKKVYSGRLWVTSDEFFNTGIDRNIIYGDYSGLIRWIKKNVLYQPVKTSNKKYIDQETLEMVLSQNYDLW